MRQNWNPGNKEPTSKPTPGRQSREEKLQMAAGGIGLSRSLSKSTSLWKDLLSSPGWRVLSFELLAFTLQRHNHRFVSQSSFQTKSFVRLYLSQNALTVRESCASLHRPLSFSASWLYTVGWLRVPSIIPTLHALPSNNLFRHNNHEGPFNHNKHSFTGQ